VVWLSGIRRGLHYELHRDHRAASGTVVHDDGLAPPFAQLLGPEAGHGIEAAAGRDADHDPHRLGWISSRLALAMRRARGNGEHGAEQTTGKSFHFLLLDFNGRRCRP